MKYLLSELNDFWLALGFLAATIIGYALGSTLYMVGGIMILLMISATLYSSNTPRNPKFITRYFGNKKNHIRITRGVFYTQGLLFGAMIGWHSVSKVFSY